MYYPIIGAVVLLIILTSIQYTLNKVVRLLEEITRILKTLRTK